MLIQKEMTITGVCKKVKLFGCFFQVPCYSQPVENDRQRNPPRWKRNRQPVKSGKSGQQPAVR